MTDRVVLCMRWGTLYPPVYANVLYNAVRDHLKGDFRFVCLTDDPVGLDDGIEHYPIPDLGYSERHWKHGAWPKLGVFLEDLYGLTGRALFIDMDSFIVGDLGRFFEEEAPFLAICGGKDWRRGRENPNPDLASGVFAFDIGHEPQIVSAFQADPEDAFDRLSLEQRFIQDRVRNWSVWPDAWVISFKRHLCRPLLVDRFLPPRDPDPETAVVAFHGDPRPVDVLANDGHNWATFPSYGKSPVRWAREYWLKYGGEEMVAAQDRLRG